jgi:hypothetical protein
MINRKLLSREEQAYVIEIVYDRVYPPARTAG